MVLLSPPPSGTATETSLRSSVLRNRRTLATPQPGIVRLVVRPEAIPTSYHKPTTTSILPSSRCGTQNVRSTSVPLLLQSVPATLLARILPFLPSVNPDPSSQSRSLRSMSNLEPPLLSMSDTSLPASAVKPPSLFQIVPVQSTPAPSLQSANQQKARR